jgi:hypothetical protein
MKVLNLNVNKLSSHETVRYNGPAENRDHGLYTIRLIQHLNSPSDVHVVDAHFTLEALVQLKIRIEAALQHMITH